MNESSEAFSCARSCERHIDFLSVTDCLDSLDKLIFWTNTMALV